MDTSSIYRLHKAVRGIKLLWQGMGQATFTQPDQSRLPIDLIVLFHVVVIYIVIADFLFLSK